MIQTTTFKKHKVILLPTDAVSNIWIRKEQIMFSKGVSPIDSAIPKHLYILSDEEIKGGDWVYNSYKNEIWQVRTTYNGNIRKEYNKKIISSTDKSLNLPEPTEEFLQEWVKNPQEEIEVEYVLEPTVHINYNYDGSVKSGLHSHKKVILINPDNTINCRLIQEDSWDNIFNSYLSYRKNFIKNYITPQIAHLEVKGLAQWLKENYEVPKRLK